MSAGAVRGAVFVVFAMATSFAISLAGSSLKNTVQVLFLPIADGFDVGRGTLAIATSLFALVAGVASPFVGHLADRWGAVPVLVVGAGLAGAVLVLCAAADDLWFFVVVYGGLGAVAFTMLANVPLGVLATQLFAGRHAGLSYAVLINGAAVGFIVLVPLWTFLDISLTWNEIMLWVALVFLLVLLPLTALLWRLTRRGAPPPAARERTSLLDGLRTTARNPRARNLIIAFGACGVTMAFLEVHLFPHMHDHGVSPAVGSVSVSVLGIVEIIGGLVAGRLCDRGRVRTVLVGAYLVRAAAMTLSPFFASSAAVIVFGAAFGASFLATIVATTVWLTRVVPAGSAGAAIGVLWTLHMVAFALTSQVGAMLADVQGHYLSTIVFGAAIAVGSAVLVGLQPDPGGPPVVREDRSETLVSAD